MLHVKIIICLVLDKQDNYLLLNQIKVFRVNIKFSVNGFGFPSESLLLNISSNCSNPPLNIKQKWTTEAKKWNTGKWFSRLHQHAYSDKKNNKSTKREIERKKHCTAISSQCPFHSFLRSSSNLICILLSCFTKWYNFVIFIGHFKSKVYTRGLAAKKTSSSIEELPYRGVSL